MVEIQKRRGHWAVIKWHDFVGWTFDEDLVWGSYIDTKTVEIKELIWQRCSVGQAPDEYCTGQASGISLEFEASDFKGEKLIKGPFIEACEALNKQSFAGRKNWRLPTALELKTLVRCTAGPQTLLKNFKQCNKGSVYPTIDATIFPNTSPNMYVTSDRSPAPYRDTVFSVHFEVGSTASSYSNYAMLGLVRCVSEK
ncbi:protein of unknown function DUF1566 [Turneriella parva DSM 21527]|uniref:Lcl C-terminal domain-containing protein n=2 Tax=Turneriella TaxID=338321 RepID=I4B9J5_TURPD|nr:protein of unknown function DUF1566 [Turneriella parva DSM 21527]